MKKQKKNRQGLYLQKRSKRWKWMAAAAAATAGGVAQSHAGMVTITLSNNSIGFPGGHLLNPDLTGDGKPDVTISKDFSFFTSSNLSHHAHTYARVNLNGVLARADFHPYDGVGLLRLGSHTKYFCGACSGVVSGSLTGSIPVSFKDLHINGGALTSGSLEVTVSAGLSAGFPNTAKVQLDSLTYHIPDSGSSLALLAMGAGGILALRRWKAAQERF